MESANHRFPSGEVLMQSGIRRASTLCPCSLALLALVSCNSSQKRETVATTSAMKPINVVFITLDTVRADHLHCYGYKKIQTPNIDSLAASGTLFEKAVTQTPLTDPSHASMFTGLNPNVTGVRDTGGFPLQPKFTTLATILQKNGWNTAAFISASVLEKAFGFNQGFSVYDDHMSHMGENNGTPLGENNGVPFATRPATLTVDHAIAWLNSQSSQPFMMWLHLYDAHEPYHPPEQFRQQYPDAPYDAEIAYEDQQLGRFLAAVKAKSPADKTLFILLSDHGESLGDHGEYNHGIFLYDSTVRIAWIMSGPGVPAGMRIEQQARTIDVQPTVLDLLGGKSPSEVQGTSMVPAFSGKQVPSNYSYEETLYPKINMGWAELRGIHTAHWMYVRAPKSELYDLDKDPRELNNVIDAHPKEYRELEQQLKLQDRLGANGSETVVANQMDQKTMEQLKSLGYVGGSGEHNVELNGKGIDPKDQVGVLKILHVAGIESSNPMPASQKIDLLRKGVAQFPTDPSLYYALGDQYKAIGRPDLALESSLDALHHGIKSAMIYTRLGELYSAKGDLQQAIASFQEVAHYNPMDVEAQTGLANAYVNSGQFTQAAHQFQQVLVIQQYAPAYSGMGLLAVKQGDFPDARKDFERAIQLDPNYVDARLNLGVLCMQTGDVPCARAAFNDFLAKASPIQYRDMIPKVHNALNTVLAQR
jgi:arylsulfatase A-like enzyme/Flp pilus assembly protein TadD